MCSEQCAKTTFNFANYNYGFAENTSIAAREIHNGDRSVLSYLWIYPTHLVATALCIAYIPIAFVINSLAALFFKLASCFSCDNNASQGYSEAASNFAYMAASQLTDLPLCLFIRIIYPPMEYKPFIIPFFCGG
jgi:hypothetical protein